MDEMTPDRAMALVVIGAGATFMCGAALYGLWRAIRRVRRWRRFYRSHHGHS